MQEVIVQDQRILACPGLPLGSHRAPRYIGSRFWRVPAPEAKDLEGEIEKLIIKQPPIGEKDDYDSKNSWISDGLPSSSRRRRRGDGRWEVGEWREK